MLNDAKIQEMLQKRVVDEEGIGSYVYAIVMASKGQMVMLGSLAGFATKYYIISFTKKNLHMIQLDMMGKKITIVGKNKSKIKFKVNKHTAGLKNQKSNLAAIVEQLS